MGRPVTHSVALAFQMKLGAVLTLVLPLLATLEMAARRAKRSTNRSAIELFAGVQTGLCIGVGNATLVSYEALSYRATELSSYRATGLLSY